MTSSWERGTAKLSSSQSISTNISCSQSSTGAMPITSTSSPTFSGEVDLLVAQRPSKGEVELPFEIVVPAYSSFFFVVGIDDGLHGDPALSYLVRFDLGPSKPLNHCKTLHLSGFSPHTINTVVRMHNLCNIGGSRPVFNRNLPEPGSARRGGRVASAVLRARDAPNARPPAFRGFRPLSGFCFAKTFLRSEPLLSLLAGAFSPPWRVPPGSGVQRKRPGGAPTPRGPDHRR